MKKMTRLVGSPHTTCVRYRQVMEQVMVEIVGVKEGSGATAEVKKREGSRGDGEERRKRRRGGLRSNMVAHICFSSIPEAQAGGPKVQGQPQLPCETCLKTNKMICKLEKVNKSDVKRWNINQSFLRTGVIYPRMSFNSLCS